VANTPQFVISLGDNFYEDGVREPDDWRFKAVFEDVYKGDKLQVPWYTIVGNHDYRSGASGIDAQVRYSKMSKRWKMPHRYFDRVETVEEGVQLHLIFLDTTKIIDGDTQQVEWLEDKLANSKAQWLFVIGHHPCISDSDHGNLPGMMQHVYPLLHQYNVDAFIAGHDHVLEHLKDGDVHMLVIGSGCKLGTMKTASPHLVYGEARLGFLNALINSNEAHLQFVSDDSDIRHEVTIQRRRK